MSMNYITNSVLTLRKEFERKKSTISTEPGIYRWWFPKACAEGLLSALDGINVQQIQKRDFDENDEYWCLYFGISQDLKQRLRWHVMQHHSASAVKSGYLSTLRQTLSALIGKAESQSEDAVNEILDKCYLEYGSTDSYIAAAGVEEHELTNNYYPLNLQNNKNVDGRVLKQLIALRKRFKR